MTEPVTTTVEDGVAVVRLDGGKMNAISHGVIEQLHAVTGHALAAGYVDRVIEVTSSRSTPTWPPSSVLPADR